MQDGGDIELALRQEGCHESRAVGSSTAGEPQPPSPASSQQPWRRSWRTSPALATHPIPRRIRGAHLHARTQDQHIFVAQEKGGSLTFMDSCKNSKVRLPVRYWVGRCV